MELSFLVVLLVTARVCVAKADIVPASVDDDFASFVARFNKTYRSFQHREYHRQIFFKAKSYIDSHNAEGSYTYELGVNEFSDIDPEVFVKQMNGYQQPIDNDNAQLFVGKGGALPSSVDWREKGVVTEVKNQGQCGSCWAFSATGSLEGQHALKTENLVSLSEQQLVDCTRADHGCSGGLMADAFKYIEDNGGIDTEESYQYKAEKGKCNPSKGTVGATCKGYHKIFWRDCSSLKEAVAKVGPVSVAMDASHGDFQHYKSGIYLPDKCSSSKLDHGVLVVGYGKEDGTEYWLVKNSWGKSWGLQGYFKIAAKSDLCGICTQAIYPLV